ncbi:YbeD family protein [Aquimonas voraii]|uniref:Uncharacterized protein n=1 Tax=Aquimonas voraii TaxID=265719 RepID=A0A1G6W303_9GAMM|nr:DUF493 domain-containing protein [Aquimonas voraii]SDD60320.1 hypothetical protein SAMN04488509_104107 [Aquimonas voraii]
MNSQPPSPFGGAPEQRGFEFPCSVEITAVGVAAADWVERVTGAIMAAGLALDPDSVRTRDSSGGKYQSVTLAFHAEAREHYEAAHNALRALPGIKWTL